MVKLVVSGGGDHMDSKKIDEIYKGLLGGGKVLYIPWAMSSEKYPSCLEWIQNVFPISEGYTVHLLSEKEFTENSGDYLSEYDGIYIGGGNTFKLLKLVKETGFIEIIKQFLNNNKPVYGGSAGAIIMGKEIHTSDDENEINLLPEEAFGCNVCYDYSIACHYEDSPSSEQKIKEYVLNYQIPVLCLPEGTGIVYDKNNDTIQGEKSAYKFNIAGEKHELPIGTEL